MLDGNKLKFGDLLAEEGRNSLFMFLKYSPRTMNIKLLRIPSDIYIPSAPVWEPDYESFLDSYYVHNHGFYRHISNMDYANPDQIEKHNNRANPYLNLGKWLYDCNQYQLRRHAFVGGRGCGKTELARQLLNSTYGLASADNNWARRCKELTDKCYKTLGIDGKFDFVRYAAEYYGIWKTKEEEKQTMADQKQVYTFIIKNICGDNYEIIIEKDFRRHDDPYRVSVYYLKNLGEKRFARSLGYRYWEQVETQLMYDLINNGFSIHKDFRDVVTQELMRAKGEFSGCSYANFDSPYQGGYTSNGSKVVDTFFENGSLKRQIDNLHKNPFEAMPKIEKVIFNPPATIVKWKDGTKTIVKCQDDDEFDWEKGLAMAYVKRAFNNERTYYGLFKKNEPDVILPNSNVRYDPKIAKEVRIIVPKDLPVTGDIIMKAHDLIMKEGDKKWENGISLEQ